MKGLRKINSLFRVSNTKGRSKSKIQNENIRLHIRLLSRMYLSTQRHSGDRDDFLPRNLITSTCIVEKRRNSGVKAELLKCLRKTSASSESQTVPPIKDAACLLRT